MQTVRRLVLAHSHLAALICAAALALRLLVPTGYMFSIEHGKFAVTLCSGFMQQQPSMMTELFSMDHAIPGHGESQEHGKAEMLCAFSSLSAQALGAADPALLAAALTFVAATEMRASPRTIIPFAPYLRPPLRGPPLYQ